MTGNCLCGAVRVTIANKPDYINDCNCSLCRKSGGAWGYFPTASVQTTGKTIPTRRADKDSPAVEIHSCEHCMTTTHWVLTETFREQNTSADVMGVNMRIFDPVDLYGVELRFPNGRDWDGKSEYGFRRPSMTISEETPW